MDLILTLTLIKDAEVSKLLVVQGETPAKADEDADAVISEVSMPKAFKTIVDAIPNFKEAEDGCEDWVTHTIDEFLDIYDLDLVKVFEDAEDEASEITEDDKKGVNTPDPDQNDSNEKSEDGSYDEDPEFDFEVFGLESPETTNPSEIFSMVLSPENLQTAMKNLKF